jgi:hypothetical protein
MKLRLIVAGLAAFGVTALAQGAEIYKDYVPSKAVWAVTFVKVNPNRMEDYLDGLKQTWVGGCEISKKQGTTEDCSIFVSETPMGGAFNVMLVTKFSSAAMMEPDEARYTKFMTEMRKTLDEAKQDKLVEGYEEMRSFFGEANFRKVEWK